jgi:putative heme-binding domain-containing protein
VRGKGSKIGPDLTNLTSRSFAAVLKDIQDPNAALNPDHVAHEVKLKDGRQFLATLRDTAAGRVMLGIGAGAELEVDRAEIKSLTASKMSLMPPKLDEQIGQEDLKHLMAFLLTEPPLMQVYHPDSPLPSRAQGEISAVLANPEPVGTLKPIQLLLVAGDKDHGIGEHDYPRWRSVWARLFSLADKVSVDLAHDWPTAAQWATADAVVFHRKGNWDAAKEKDFDAFLARGGGVTLIHWSLEAGAAAPSLARRLGLASDSSLTKYRHGEIEVSFSPHPIMRGFEKTRFYDEMYWNLVPSGEICPLATAAEAGKQYPHAWAQEPTTGGRIFVTLGGHYSAVFDDPLFRILLLRGIAWSAGQPVDRFNNLVEAGMEPQF